MPEISGERSFLQNFQPGLPELGASGDSFNIAGNSSFWGITVLFPLSPQSLTTKCEHLPVNSWSFFCPQKSLNLLRPLFNLNLNASGYYL